MGSALKILMLAPTPYFSDRGCHVRIYEEARALIDRGHDVVIVTYHLGRNIGNIPVIRIPNIPWYRKLSAGPSWHKPYLDILLLYKALATARRFRPDIIHAHLHEGAFLAAIAKRSFRTPLLFDCQGSLCGELLDHGFMRRGGLLHRFFAKIEDWVNRQPGFIVTSSSPTVDALKAASPEISSRLTSLPDAVDTDYFVPGPKDPELGKKLGLPDGKKLIVYLGAMTEYQGVDLLLKALQQLSAHRDDFHALLMGYPEGNYVEQARQLGLADKVTFTGKLEYAQAPRYLRLGDVAVSPKISSTEANGKLLNYMACGLPCVVFDNQINRELLADCGSYVLSQQPGAFAAGLRSMLDDAGKRHSFSAQVREHAVKRHSWPTRIVDLEEIYCMMLNRPS